MIVTYTKSANNSFKGNGWVGYESLNFKSTLIFHNLWKVIQLYPELNFDEICGKIQFAYDTKTVKSDCRISINRNVLEIIKINKSLPEIWIVKDK